MKFKSSILSLFLLILSVVWVQAATVVLPQKQTSAKIVKIQGSELSQISQVLVSSNLISQATDVGWHQNHLNITNEEISLADTPKYSPVDIGYRYGIVFINNNKAREDIQSKLKNRDKESQLDKRVFMRFQRKE